MPEPRSQRFSSEAILVTVVVSVLAMFGVVVAVRFITLPIGLQPDGPKCSVEDDPGSGPSNSGLEKIEWGLLPERVCVVEPRAPDEVRRSYGSPNTSGPDLFFLLSYPAALVIGPVIGLLAGALVQRRRRRTTTAEPN